MQIINQLAAPLAQSVSIARQQSTDKADQIRREQALRKAAATSPDSYEHQVESAEEITPIRDPERERSDQKQQQQKPPRDSDVEPPHIDVKV